MTQSNILTVTQEAEELLRRYGLHRGEATHVNQIRGVVTEALNRSRPSEDVERPWQSFERNYSGGRFGVWHDAEWTMLRMETGVADATASIKRHEAWDLALRLSPALKERLDELFAGKRRAEAALHSFTWADTIAPLLRKVADDWDCDSSRCEFASSDMGGLSCPHIEGERGCRAVEAAELREFADALETRAALTSREER